MVWCVCEVCVVCVRCVCVCMVCVCVCAVWSPASRCWLNWEIHWAEEWGGDLVFDETIQSISA